MEDCSEQSSTPASEFEGWCAFEALRFWLGYEGADRLLRFEYDPKNRPARLENVGGDALYVGHGDLVET